MNVGRFRVKVKRGSSTVFRWRWQRCGQATSWPSTQVYTPFGQLDISRTRPRDLRARQCPRSDNHFGHAWPTKYDHRGRNPHAHRVCPGRPS